MKLFLTSLTHPGKVRENNEDAIAVCPDLVSQSWTGTKEYIPLGDLGALTIVADGMGGANAGEVASSMAIDYIRQSFVIESLPLYASDDEKCEFLKSAIKDAGAAILAHVENAPETIGMGTTVVVLWLIGDKAHIAWCGDSRCYVFNPDKGLRPLTKDHSYVQELVDKGELRPDQMIEHPDSNLITRGLGDIDTDSTPDTLTVFVSEGDIFILCSDGLCGYCQDAAIERIVYKNLNDITNCERELFELALQAGGYDNISIAILATLPDSAKKRKVGFKTRIRRLTKK